MLSRMQRTEIIDIADHPLLQHAFFKDLEPELQSDLVEAAELYALTGDELHQRLPRSRALFVCRGELEVHHRGHLVGLAGPDETLGLLRALVNTRSNRFSLRGDPEDLAYTLRRKILERICEESPAQARAWTRAVDREVLDLLGQRDRLRQHLWDHFRDGQASMVSPPYHCDEVQLQAFVVETDPQALRTFLDTHGCYLEPLPSFPASFMLIFAKMNGLKTKDPEGAGVALHYHETTLLVPCRTCEFLPGVFCSEIYPDNYLATVVGREVYGLPKRFGETIFGQRSARLTLNGQTKFRARWADETPLEGTDFAKAITQAVMGDSSTDRKAADAAAVLFQFLKGTELEDPFLRMPFFAHYRMPKMRLPTFGKALQSQWRRRFSCIPTDFPLDCMRDFQRLEEPQLDVPTWEFPLPVKGCQAFALTLRLSISSGFPVLGVSYLDKLASLLAGPFSGPVRGQLQRMTLHAPYTKPDGDWSVPRNLPGRRKRELLRDLDMPEVRPRVGGGHLKRLRRRLGGLSFRK